MKQYKKHIDDLYKEKLGSYRETPPADAWEELESRLDTLKPGAPAPPYRWLLHLAIVSLLLVSSISIFTKFFNRNNPDEKTLAQNTQGPISQLPNPAPAPSTQPSPSQQSLTPNGTALSGTQSSPAVSGSSLTPSTYSPSSGRNSSGAANRTHQPSSSSGKQANHNTGTPYLSATSAAAAGTLSNHNRGRLSNPAPEEENENNNQLQAASPNTTLSVVKSADAQATPVSNKPATKSQTSTASNSRTRKNDGFSRIEAGVKVGYEGGFSNGTDNKAVVSPYLQYNINSKLGILTQPGVKFAETPEHNIGTPSTYYNVNPESGTLTQSQSTLVIGATTYTVTHYHYTQPHDSIVKSNHIGGPSMQYELPILLKYNLTRKLSVYGGVNFVFNKLTSITENISSKTLTRSSDTTIMTTGNITQPNFGFNYAGNPIQDYTKLSADKTGYQFSTGFMVGVSYAYSKKWLFDALMEQASFAPDVKAGYNINAPLSAPYFRLSIGYKLTK